MSVTAVEEAEVYQSVNITRGLTSITLRVNGTGTVKLSVKADPESSLNPAYLSAKEEADINPPTICEPIQTPAADSVQPDQLVKVSVNVTDIESGVKKVTLHYTNDTVWYSIPMAFNTTSMLWEATIPGHMEGTQVKYRIEAYDNAGNTAVKDNAGQYYAYVVIPEFPIATLLTVFLSSTLTLTIMLTIMVKRRRKPKSA